ncbi:hypothetical protein D6825_01375 [Candidatus Woesearchaeota archaeon]|nr:MAG: hypothetical protein D6825_01375 [Candidatus Woesearchaeota archaeon]
MKKGQFAVFELLLKFLPHILVALILLSILVGLYNLFGPSKSPAEQDFERVIGEVKSLESGKIVVPLQGGEAYTLFAYSKGSFGAQKLCSGSACLCLFEDELHRTSCKSFDDRDFVYSRVRIFGDKKTVVLRYDGEKIVLE